MWQRRGDLNIHLRNNLKVHEPSRGLSAPLYLSTVISHRHMHFWGTFQTCHSPPVHQMPSEFPTNPTHLFTLLNHTHLLTHLPVIIPSVLYNPLTCSFSSCRSCHLYLLLYPISCLISASNIFDLLPALLLLVCLLVWTACLFLTISRLIRKLVQFLFLDLFCFSVCIWFLSPIHTHSHNSVFVCIIPCAP